MVGGVTWGQTWAWHWPQLSTEHRYSTVSDHFAPWSFHPQSLRPNQKSLRSIIEVTSPHTRVISLHKEVTSLHDIIKLYICLQDRLYLPSCYNRPIYKYDLDDMFVIVSFTLISLCPPRYTDVVDTLVGNSRSLIDGRSNFRNCNPVENLKCDQDLSVV